MPRKVDPNKPKNALGGNQHRARPLIEEFPNLQEILQGYVDSRVLMKDIPEEFRKDHGVDVKLRTIENYMKNLGVVTTRRNGLTAGQKDIAIDLIAQDDPLQRWGGRLIQEKLGRKSIHIPRDEILALRRKQNPQGVFDRHPCTRKVHHHGLWSIGPNEEWCVDGHEKILRSMGISVWGVIDKFSRMELGLWAMPNARIPEIPPFLFLRLVQEKGGMPMTTTSDKGGEVGLLISLVTALRHRFQPFLPEGHLPAFKAVKSTYNITRERGWRPIWEKELGNVAHEYKVGKIEAGYMESDPIHCAISSWLWGKIVQEKLDDILYENQIHRIRKQRGILLPSGARRIDLYTKGEQYGYRIKDRLIEIDEETIKDLLLQYDQPELLMFGTPEDVELCENIYNGIGCPGLHPRAGWKIFIAMVDYYTDKM